MLTKLDCGSNEQQNQGIFFCSMRQSRWVDGLDTNSLILMAMSSLFCTLTCLLLPPSNDTKNEFHLGTALPSSAVFRSEPFRSVCDLAGMRSLKESCSGRIVSDVVLVPTWPDPILLVDFAQGFCI